MLDEDAQHAVIRGMRAGRREAWAALYDGYSADVWRYVARLVGGQSGEVADVVQETFLAAARSARKFDATRGTLWGWLTGIAHHHVAAHWRGIGRESRWKALVEAQIGAAQQGSASVDSLANGRAIAELADHVRSVLAGLPADYTALLTGKYLDDLSLEELAAQFGGSSEAMKSKLARARREFRERYERGKESPQRQPGNWV